MDQNLDNQENEQTAEPGYMAQPLSAAGVGASETIKDDAGVLDKPQPVANAGAEAPPLKELEKPASIYQLMNRRSYGMTIVDSSLFNEVVNLFITASGITQQNNDLARALARMRAASMSIDAGVTQELPIPPENFTIEGEDDLSKALLWANNIYGEISSMELHMGLALDFVGRTYEKLIAMLRDWLDRINSEAIRYMNIMDIEKFEVPGMGCYAFAEGRESVDISSDYNPEDDPDIEDLIAAGLYIRKTTISADKAAIKKALAEIEEAEVAGDHRYPVEFLATFAKLVKGDPKPFWRGKEDRSNIQREISLKAKAVTHFKGDSNG